VEASFIQFIFIPKKGKDSKLKPLGRDRAVDELIELVGDVDDILQKQLAIDVDNLSYQCSRQFSNDENHLFKNGVLGAY
jgi:hypothetical protein